MIPFEHCQNAKFIVSAIDSYTFVQPNWISIDQQHHSIIIATNNITSVSSFNLIFSAQLFTYVYYRYDDVTTPNYKVSINFENNNWALLSYSYPSHLVYNHIAQIQIYFTDDENDKVTIKLIENPLLSWFINYSSSTSAVILIQSNSAETSSTSISISYTDSYHRENQYWQQTEIQLILFASQPPVFVSSLDAIVVSKWQDAVYNLPNYSDPDSFNITTRLNSDVPDWIALKNFTIFIKSKSKTNVTEGLTQINLMLVDETNSWTKYVLNVTIESIESPFFNYINNMSKQQLINGVILNITSPNRIIIVDCNNYQEISWIIFSNSTLKLIANTTNYSQTWLRLASTDSCSNKVYSNLFQIISTQNPVISTNKFGPLFVPRGIYTLFEIADNLFIYFDNNSLTYNSSIISWSQNYFWDIGIKQSYNKTNYLYVFSNFSMNWNASISASNLYSKSEIVFYIDIIKWASKNCAKCSGPSQSQCTEWNSGYILDPSGMWLFEAHYFVFQGLTFYRICSIIAFISTVIHICLSCTLNRNLLNSIINLQLIIVFLLCSNQINSQSQELLSNILFIKFDFGFLHQLAFKRNIIWWEAKFERMIEIQFYCQSTAQNYFL